MMKTSEYIPTLIEKIGLQKLKRMTGMLFSFPLVVIASIIGIHFLIWRTDPLIRFIHMIWVLGFWMVGTAAMFAFIIPVWLRLSNSLPTLVISSLAIATAIYFTPLYKFTNQFQDQTSLILPAAIGILNVTISWLIALRFRDKLVKT